MFIPVKKYIYILGALLRLTGGNLTECQKKILKIQLNRTAILDQFLLIVMYYKINFNGYCLINNNISITKKVINIYISYILNQLPRNLHTDFTLLNCLFGSLKKLTKNTDTDKYQHSDYGIEFGSNFHLYMEVWEKLSLFLKLI